jgi:hypothetical protein
MFGFCLILLLYHLEPPFKIDNFFEIFGFIATGL